MFQFVIYIVLYLAFIFASLSFMKEMNEDGNKQKAGEKVILAIALSIIGSFVVWELIPFAGRFMYGKSAGILTYLLDSLPDYILPVLVSILLIFYLAKLMQVYVKPSMKIWIIATIIFLLGIVLYVADRAMMDEQIVQAFANGGNFLEVATQKTKLYGLRLLCKFGVLITFIIHFLFGKGKSSLK